jgi:hypothetical protein
MVQDRIKEGVTKITAAGDVAKNGQFTGQNLRPPVTDAPPHYTTAEINAADVDYLTAALWSSHDTDNFGEEVELDNYDFAPGQDEKVCADWHKFASDPEVQELCSDLGIYMGQAAHDFWLTRNGHGAGFWDRGPEEGRKRLSEISKTYGEYNLFLGFDDQVYAYDMPESPPLPDSDDYEIAASDAVRMAGIPESDVTNVWSAYDQRAGENIGIDASFEVASVDADYLGKDTAFMLNSLPKSELERTLNFACYAPGNNSLTASSAQYISIRLSDEEQAAVIAVLDPNNEDFADDLVSYWSDGNPSGMQDCFGYSRPMVAWNRVSEVVEQMPGLSPTLAFAHQLRVDACETFASECDYIGSDEWAAERAES